MKTEIVQFEVGHAIQITETNARECDGYYINRPEFEAVARELGNSGPAYTILIDRKIVFCGGVSLLGYGRGEVWLVFSTELYRHVKTVYRVMKMLLSIVVEQFRLTRLQTVVKCDIEAGTRFVEHFGFEREGLLRAYGPNGEDFYIYGRVYHASSDTYDGSFSGDSGRISDVCRSESVSGG